MNRLIMPLVLAAVVSLSPIVSAAAAANQSGSAEDAAAKALYVAALEQMRHRQQPAFARYAIALDSQGVGMKLIRGAPACSRGGPCLRLYKHDGASHLVIPAAYRATDFRTALQMPDGTYASTQEPFFSAMWTGVYEWMRYGLGGPPNSSPFDTPAPQMTSAPSLPVIAIVTSLGTGYYRVESDRPSQCADGSPAHQIHVVARRDPQVHPLTDATISSRNGMFCSMRFREEFRGIHPTALGILTFNFENDHGYTLIDKEHIDLTPRVLGMAIMHFTIDVTYSDFTFPASVDASLYSIGESR